MGKKMTDTKTDTLSDALAPGTWLGRYQIIRLIGRGGMGCVYEAVHRDLGKRVAVKVLLPALAASPEARSRFLREGQAASRIRHPNVVDVTDVAAEGPTSYLVMEYLEGEDLASLIARQGALSLVETADTMLPVLAAIAEAHGQGVIHRDLKPENIFLARAIQGGKILGTVGGIVPKVLDFGISKLIDDPTALSLTGTSATFGTVYYLPPEQLRGAREADARSDQYALGTILYECVTGHRAFSGDGVYTILKAVAEGDYPPARARRPDLPAPVEEAISRAMRVDPAARWASVRELGGALLELASPNVRVLWTPAFARAPGESWPPAPNAARTLLLPSSTSVLPGLEVVPRRSPVPFIAAAVAALILAVAIGVVGVAPRPRPAEPQTPTGYPGEERDRAGAPASPRASNPALVSPAREAVETTPTSGSADPTPSPTVRDAPARALPARRHFVAWPKLGRRKGSRPAAAVPVPPADEVLRTNVPVLD
jgi:serine/threonine-protein kinase